MRLHGDVRVADDRGWDEDGRSRGELNDEFEFPQHELPAAGMVEVAQCCNDAPAKRNIEVVDVLTRHSLRAKVDRYGRKNDLLKVALEVGIVSTDRVKG